MRAASVLGNGGAVPPAPPSGRAVPGGSIAPTGPVGLAGPDTPDGLAAPVAPGGLAGPDTPGRLAGPGGLAGPVAPGGLVASGRGAFTWNPGRAAPRRGGGCGSGRRPAPRRVRRPVRRTTGPRPPAGPGRPARHRRA